MNKYGITSQICPANHFYETRSCDQDLQQALHAYNGWDSNPRPFNKKPSQVTKFFRFIGFLYSTVKLGYNEQLDFNVKLVF